MIHRYERVVIDQNISLVIVSSEYDDQQVWTRWAVHRPERGTGVCDWVLPLQRVEKNMMKYLSIWTISLSTGRNMMKYLSIWTLSLSNLNSSFSSADLVTSLATAQLLLDLTGLLWYVQKSHGLLVRFSVLTLRSDCLHIDSVQPRGGGPIRGKVVHSSRDQPTTTLECYLCNR